MSKRKRKFLKPGSQNSRLLTALQLGSVFTQERYSNPDLRFGYLSRRIKDIKEYLEPKGLTVKIKRIAPRNFAYWIEKLEKKEKRWSPRQLYDAVKRFLFRQRQIAPQGALDISPSSQALFSNVNLNGEPSFKSLP